jgi:hypothetical protein
MPPELKIVSKPVAVTAQRRNRYITCHVKAQQLVAR